MGVGFVVFLLIDIFTGSWGHAALAGAIVGVVVFMFQEDKADMKAYYNARDYWAKGGPEHRGRR